jgi:hypothetical protein
LPSKKQDKLVFQQGQVAGYVGYSGLGERDETLDWLERGYRQDSKMTFLKVQGNWNSLRDDQRFQDLLRRIGLKP